MFLVFCCLNSQYQSEVGDSQAASELLDLILNKVTLFFSSQIFFISIISILFFCIISISCSTKFYIFTPSTSSTNRSFFCLNSWITGGKWRWEIHEAVGFIATVLLWVSAEPGVEPGHPRWAIWELQGGTFFADGGAQRRLCPDEIRGQAGCGAHRRVWLS